MTPSRETILAALKTTLSATLLKPTGPFQTISDTFQLWTDVPPGDQPAIRMQGPVREHTIQSRGLPPKRTISVDLWCYAPVPTGTPGHTITNPLLEALDTAMLPSTAGADSIANALTLGGIVSHAWIEGDTLVDTGDLDARSATSEQNPGGQAVLIVPVRILVP